MAQVWCGSDAGDGSRSAAGPLGSRPGVSIGHPLARRRWGGQDGSPPAGRHIRSGRRAPLADGLQAPAA
jgi:hypothetical protein